jgi:FHA domain-containing protein
VVTIEVVNYRGGPMESSLVAQFGEAGGTIGRAANNTMPLEDPERAVSRVHAQVVLRDGTPVLISRGRNGLFVNDQFIEAGQEIVLEDNAVLLIGAYQMHARVQHDALAQQAAAPPASPSDDPFAGLGILPGEGVPATGENPATAPASLLPSDPMGRLQAAPRLTPGAGSQGSTMMIPEDFDPLADPLAPQPAQSATSAEQLVAQSGSADSLDSLFDLGGGGGLPAPGENAWIPAPAAPDSPVDPLAAFTGAQPRPVAAPSEPDHVPEIHGSFALPTARSEMAPQPAPQPPARPTPRAAPRPAVPAVHPVPAAPAVAPAAADQLLQSLLAGMGTPNLQLPQGVTPELMQRIGLLLREATKGTLDLLRARATTKREVRASVTMIVAKDNNPLKFSPDVSAAVGYLIRPPEQGFLPPVEAMRDAYDDLRAHQIGMMAGMRSALAAVLARFAPDRLEERLAEKSVLDSLLPINRRAKLWDLFHVLYKDIAQEAEDDFHSLFGREFLRGYEEQIKRLEQGGDEPGSS